MAENTSPLFSILHVIGPHAGETPEEILNRKIEDCTRVGFTFWVLKSHKARPDQVAELCRAATNRQEKAKVIFIAPSSPGAAKDTKGAQPAKEFSLDGESWSPMPKGLGPVTGALGGGVWALRIEKLRIALGEIDLWNYGELLNPQLPIKFNQTAPAFCAAPSDTSKHCKRMKSRFRPIIAEGDILLPSCALIR